LTTTGSPLLIIASRSLLRNTQDALKGTTLISYDDELIFPGMIGYEEFEEMLKAGEEKCQVRSNGDLSPLLAKAALSQCFQGIHYLITNFNGSFLLDSL